MAHSALLIGDAGDSSKPIADGIPPDNSVSGLIFKAIQNFRITILIHAAMQRFPVLDEVCGGFRARVTLIVNVLDHRFS